MQATEDCQNQRHSGYVVILKDFAMTSNDAPTLEQDKAELRSVMTAIREESARGDSAAVAIHTKTLIERLRLKQGDVAAGYWPIKTELDPRPVLFELAASGMKTALPTTPKAGEPLVFRHWQDGDEVIAGLYGTSEPSADSPICTPKLILVPMLAFDSAGFRLGYGGGFYDRTLAAIREGGGEVYAIGIAYESQRVERVPVGIHDAKLDGVLTDSGLYLT